MIERDTGVKKFEEHDIEFMETVRKQFLERADARFLVMDGELPRESIQRAVRTRVASWMTKVDAHEHE